MELSLPQNCAGDPRGACDEVAGSETAGLDAVRVTEASGFAPPAVRGCPVARSEHLRTGGANLDVYSRTPALVARTGAGRDAVLGGREAGATMLNVTPVGPEPARPISTVKNWLQGA